MISGTEYLPIIGDIARIKSEIENLKRRMSNNENLDRNQSNTLNNLLSRTNTLQNDVNTLSGYFSRGRQFRTYRFRYSGHRIMSEQTTQTFTLNNIEGALNLTQGPFGSLVQAINQAINDVLGQIPDVSNFNNMFRNIADEFNKSKQNTMAFHMNNCITNITNFKNRLSSTNSAFSNITTKFNNIKSYMLTAKSDLSSISTQIQGLYNMINNIKSGIDISTYGTTAKKLWFNTKIDGSGTQLYFTIRCGLLHDTDNEQSTFSYYNVFDAINKLTDLAKSHIQYVMSHASWGSGIVDDWQCAMEHIKWATRLAIGVLGVQIQPSQITPAGHSITRHGLTVGSYTGRLEIGQISWSTGYVVNPLTYAIYKMKKQLDTYANNLSNMKTKFNDLSNKFNNISTMFGDIHTNFNTITENIFTKQNDNAILHLNRAIQELQNAVNRMNTLSSTIKSIVGA